MPTLDQHLPGPLASVRFFNGRLLTGTDLTREQAALYERDARVAAALGTGVVAGLDVSPAATSTAALPQVRVTAGRAITPGGAVLVLTGDTVVDLTLPAPAATPPRSDWRRCDAAPSDPPPTGPDRALYVLALRWLPQDSTTLARVLQADRSTDPCTIDSVIEGVSFRLVRLSAVEAATAALSDERLQNVVAHACYGTAAVPDSPDADAPPADRALDALRAADDLTACDVPLAVLCLTRAAGVRWVDLWAARRRPTPPLGHEALERVTGPRSAAEAEARLLQFQAQLVGLPTPSSGGLSGTAKGRFTWLPPAGQLPVAWAETQAWRSFFGAAMAPPTTTACDASLLPPLLAHAALGAAIPTESGGATVPAIDVYAGRADGEGADTALVYVQSTEGRVRVELTGTALTSSVADSLTVRATSADGQRAWDAIRDTSGTSWLTPNLPPGAYTVGVVSDEVAGTTLALSVVGGRVHHGTIAVTALTGTIRVTVEEDKYTDTWRVTATKGAETRTATHTGGAVWTFSGVPVGGWTVRANAHGRYGEITSESVLAQVQPGATTNVSLGYLAQPERPSTSVTFLFEQVWVKIALLETSFTDSDDGTVVVKDFDAYGAYAREAEASSSYLAELQREIGYARKETDLDTGERTADGKAIVVRGPKTKGTRKRAGMIDAAKSRSGYTPWTPLPDEVRAWLSAWQKWVAGTEADHRTRGKTRDSTPRIELQAGKDVLALAGSSSTSRTPEGYAVFGATWMPIVVTRARYRIPGAYVPAPKRDLLDRFAVYPRQPDWSIDELASWPKGILEDVFPIPVGDPEELVKELDRSAVIVRETLEYIPGMNDQLREAVGGSVVALANLDQASLVRMGLDGVSAALLLSEARAAAPADTWSVTEAGITGGKDLAGAGYATVRDVAGADKGELAATLGVSEATAAGMIASAQEKLVGGVVTEALAVVTTMAAAESGGHEVDVTALGADAATAAMDLGVSEAFVTEGMKASSFMSAAVGTLGFAAPTMNTVVRLRR